MRALKPKLSEDRLIAAIVQALGEQPLRLAVGIGDDAAAWKAPRSHLSLITTDTLVDGVHFLSAQTTPASLGHKALAVNLSDIAAMGGRPALAVVALGVTDVVDERWAREFYAGMAALARRCGCDIAGGDIVRSPVLSLSVTVAGDVRRSDLRLRSGAKPGDVACVTGPLGLAAAGLRLFRHEPNVGKGNHGPSGPCPAKHVALLRAAYETPAPRLDEGGFLGSSRATHAMMDVSDGLSLDLARMARASGVDATIDLDALRPHAALAGFDDVADLMLHGGDDYELLVAVDARAYPHLAKRYLSRFKRELAAIGKFDKGAGHVWESRAGRRSEHIARGYDHLSSKS